MTLPSRKNDSNFSSQLFPQECNTYTSSYTSNISEATRQELREKITYIPEYIDAKTSQLTTLTYQVDHAIREACLASPEQWVEESGIQIFTSSNKLKVYLGKAGVPLTTDKSQKRIQELGISTVITARIVLGLWNIRRSNRLLQTENGNIPMRLEDIFEWRGIKKHSYIPKPDSDKRYTDGYETKYKNQVMKDLDLLASCCIKGQIICTFEGKRARVYIDSSYMQYGIITRSTSQVESVIAGIFVHPGDWLQTYIKYNNYFIAKTGRNIFQFHFQNQQHELKLALYLTERWRQQTHSNHFDEPIHMAHLLAFSMIRVDKKHLTSQFAPRILEALENLQQQAIIGHLQCITPVDTSGLRWGNTWLASQWIISPLLEQKNTSINKTKSSSKEPKSTSSIKAIETLYNGRRYRSRIEAKWNIFFETLDIDNRYEEEGYTFEGICYLPDFWLPDQQCWIEIKGKEPEEEELKKARLLSLYKNKSVYIFFGEAWLPNQQKHDGAYCFREGGVEKGYFWYECLKCKVIGLASSQNKDYFPCQCPIALSHMNSYSNNSNRLLEAYTLANQARFEYGEQGNKRVQKKSKYTINEGRDEE